MLPINRKISPYNHYKNNQIKYIRIHDVGTVSSAKNNADYFYGGQRGASAHYFTDDVSIWQSVEDYNSSWDVGDGYNNSTGKWLSDITNSNGISIEMCLVGPKNVTDKTVANTIELVKMLMKKYNIPISRVVRHYDASRKSCPGSMQANNWAKWQSFKAKLGTGGTGTVVNNGIIEQSGGHNLGDKNLNAGFLRTGEFVDLIHSGLEPNYADKELVPYLRKQFASHLLCREVRWYKYASHYKITIGWLNEAQAKQLEASIKNTCAGQFVNYDKSKVKAIKEPNSWRVEAIVPNHWDGVYRAVVAIKQDASSFLLAKRIYTYPTDDGKKTVVICNLTTLEAKSMLDDVRKWLPNLSFNSVLQY